MPTAITRMNIHCLRSSKTYLTEFEQSNPNMLAQKIVDILPSASMSQSILRTLGIDYGVGGHSGGSGPFSYFTRAAHHLPGLVKKACSPSTLFTNSSTPSPHLTRAVEKAKTSVKSRHSTSNQIVPSSPVSQENTPPSLKRPSNRLEATATASATSPKKPTTESFALASRDESRILRPRTSLSVNVRTSLKSKTSPDADRKLLDSPYVLSRPPHYYQAHFDVKSYALPETCSQKLIEEAVSAPSSLNMCAHRKPKPVRTTKRKTKKNKSDGSPFLHANTPYYYQAHWDKKSIGKPESSLQMRIEVPSWRVNDILSSQYANEAANHSRVLRARPSTGRTKFQVSLPVSQPPTKRRRVAPASKRPSASSQEGEEVEDTSDEAYIQRHARLETEETRRERISNQKIAEAKLRLRIEHRERESWRKRQSTRVHNFADIDPEYLMPTSLTAPLHKVRHIHVREEIPVIAFGVKVPTPNFGGAAFSLSDLDD